MTDKKKEEVKYAPLFTEEPKVESTAIPDTLPKTKIPDEVKAQLPEPTSPSRFTYIDVPPRAPEPPKPPMEHTESSKPLSCPQCLERDVLHCTYQLTYRKGELHISCSLCGWGKTIKVIEE